MTDDEKYEALVASAPEFLGKFVVGVATTGIYCLPICRARKPLRKNVRFFETFDQARAAGLRACKKCKPDQYELGLAPDLARLEDCLAQQDFRSVNALVEAVGWGASKTQSVVREHFQCSPQDLLTKIAIERACKLLGTLSVSEIAVELGYDSPSSFSDRFCIETGMLPSHYAKGVSGQSIPLQLGTGYRRDALLSRLARDADGVLSKVEGSLAQFCVGSQEVLLDIGETPSVTVFGSNVREGYDAIRRIFGLNQDVEAFERKTVAAGFPQLIEGRQGTRIAQTQRVFDSVLWAIVGQQMNLSFTRQVLRKLASRLSAPTESGLIALPTPTQI